MSDQKYLSVNALTKYIKRKFDVDPHLQDVLVRGEISNYKQHSSGHMYFTLKDDKARILAVMFSSNNKNMKFSPENGMKILIKGDISLYEPSGQYQIYIKEMQPDGIGDLFLAYEQLKKKLEQEGLFLQSVKKSLPPFPKKIGVITSPTGAAIRDILTTLKRRYPIANILILPALVQGAQAGSSIVKAIENANKLGDIDVLIVGRGGGSIEELWPFNEEIVARAIFSSVIPIISAVGHETDFTIADFVADLRAPTPTGAAELAVPHIDDLKDKVAERQSRLFRAMREKISFQKARIDRIQKSYAFRYPKKLYEQKLEQVDRLTDRLMKGTTLSTNQKKEKLDLLMKRITRNHPNQLLLKGQDSFEKTQRRLVRATIAIHQQKRQQFQHVLSTLDALSPLKIMDRGYSLVYTKNQQLIKKIEQVQKNDLINIQLNNGKMECQVINVERSDMNV
ncbi:exodeoxyribonuclease VII large subunit [Bacillus sp. CGMCC 1.16607]|uniref:exodeoxyribonuclease VII large subunit n=1 Tax=Bacillus sp. CGMCC 1.16607 TaxID=3351842 RepID=UPI003640C60E